MPSRRPPSFAQAAVQGPCHQASAFLLALLLVLPNMMKKDGISSQFWETALSLVGFGH